jgi:hypothetical protein
MTAGRGAAALKGAAVLVFLGHMAATCAPNIPEQSALGAASPPFHHYEELTGLWQTWDMFTTIPYYHHYDVDIEVTEIDGHVDHVGPLLPGLRPYDHALRTETLFMRLLYDAHFDEYLNQYADQACAEIRARRGHGGQKIVVHESCERMRWLNQIREDGVISNHEEHSSRPFVCGG